MADLPGETEIRQSSFYWPVRLLPAPRRRAMTALYAFCRMADDLADDMEDKQEARRLLQDWRDWFDGMPEASAPDAALAAALRPLVEQFGAEKAHFQAVLDGVAMDLEGRMLWPPDEALQLYTHRVAGCVGLLSLPLFGCAPAAGRDFALALGDALQYTNILRDVAEDAARGRIYFPREWGEETGLPGPEEWPRHPQMPVLRERLARRAHESFQRARTLLPPQEKAALRPALWMMKGYYGYWRIMERRGWDVLYPRPRLSLAQKLACLLPGRFP